MKILMIILLGFVLGNGKSFNLQLKFYLDERLSSYEKYDYEILRVPRNARLEIDTDRNFRIARNYAYVPVKIFDSKNNAAHSVVTLRVKLYRKVLVSKQTIGKDENLLPYMFNKELMNVSRLEGQPADEKVMKNYRSKIIINEKSVLLQNMIEPVPVINHGEKVIIHTGRNGVDISIEGIARQDGSVDQIISVQCRDQIFKAKVIDKYNLSLVE